MAGKEQLQHQLVNIGNKLLNPPFSIDELLSLLERVEASLSKVDQSPGGSMVDALLPLRKALVSDKLLRHSDTDVKVSVALCVSETLRITAPNAPYEDDQMKEIFHLIVAVFQKLSHMSSSCYSKVVSILVTVAMTRAVVVMLDLECHTLITEMFLLFLEIIRFNNSDLVLTSMEAILTLVIWESEDISLEILVPLLASVKKENQNISPTSWKLGKKVIKNCAVKIEPYLSKAVYSLGVSIDDYDQIVGSIYQSASNKLKCFEVLGSEEHLATNKRQGVQLLENTMHEITSKSAGIQEIDDKGQSADFPSPLSSLRKYMCQPVALMRSLSQQSEKLSNCQNPNEENKENSEAALSASNKGRITCSEMTMVQGYEVKPSNAPILTAIFAKYGDIAADCQYNAPSMRSCLLEIVCDIVHRLQNSNSPLCLSEIKVIQNEVKALEPTNLKVSWLSQPLAKISELENIAHMQSMLKSVKANGIMVIRAATKELEDALADLVALQNRMGEAEKRVNAMKLVVQKIDEAIKEVEQKERLWQRQMNELL